MAQLDSRGWAVAVVLSTAVLAKVLIIERLPLVALIACLHLVLMASLFLLARRQHSVHRRFRELLGLAGALSIALFARFVRDSGGCVELAPRPALLTLHAPTACPHASTVTPPLQSRMAPASSSHG